MRRALAAGFVACLASPASAGNAPIIGGTPTATGQFPSVVALTVGGGLCTGTLITRDWVLTAAHCITPSIVGLPDQAAVTSGIRVHFNTINLSQSQGQVFRASMTIPKPGFSRAMLGANDIGLIKLASPATTVEPTPVNLKPAVAPIGIVVTMVGFGATQIGGGGNVGVQFVLSERRSTSCTPYQLLDANLLCFSQTDSKGKCVGDSGGPSFAMVDGKRTVVGVTSFGDGDCAQLGADTRTDIERAFLLQHIPSLEGCTTAAECDTDEICFQSKCIATPFGPGGLGSPCTADAECDSGTCRDGPGGMHCTQSCTVGATNTCPEGLECIDVTAGTVCWGPEDDTGCCDSSGRGAPTMALGIAVVAFAWRRRRRRC